MSRAALDGLLGKAYTAKSQGRHREAMEFLRNALATSHEMRKIADAKRNELAEIVRARSRGGVCGCHVSKVQGELLTEAMEGVANA